MIYKGFLYTFLKYSLQKSHIFKCTYYNYILNISLCIIFVLMTTILCIIHYKGSPTLEEIQYKHNKTKEYIMNKIKKVSFLLKIASVKFDMKEEK